VGLANLIVKGERVQKEVFEGLVSFFRGEKRVLVAYLFGSHAKRTQTRESDVDIAILLSETPEKLLEHYTYLMDKLFEVFGADVDLIILNMSPPLLRYQVIKHGEVIYCRNEEVRIMFEARAQCEYLDFSHALARYDECFMEQILA